MATYTLAIGVGRYVLNKRLTLVDSGALTAAASLTRNSTATYWDSAGELATAAIDTARTDYDPSDNSLRGLLVEGQKTNRYWHEDPANFVLGSNVSYNGKSTIKGMQIGQFVPAAGRGADTGITHGGIRIGPGSGQLAIGEDYAIRIVFDSAAPITNLRVVDSGQLNVQFDVATLTISSDSTGTATLVDIGDGLVELRFIYGDVQTTVNLDDIVVQNRLAADADGADYWAVGAIQIELDKPHTSYIPPSGSDTTREDDDVTATVGGSFPDPVSYDIVATAGTDQDAVLYQADDGTENNRLRIARVSGNLRVIVTDGGTEQANLDLGAIADFTEFTVRAAFAANDVAASLNGAASVTDSSATMPSGLANRRLGADTSGDHWNGWIKDKVEHRQRLDNTWLETGIATLIGDVALNRSFYLAAAQGSYTLSGQSVGLIGSFILTADQGAYTLSGQAVGLNRSFYLSLAQGAYSLTGQDLTFLRLWFAQSQAGNAWTEQSQAGNAWTEQ